MHRVAQVCRVAFLVVGFRVHRVILQGLRFMVLAYVSMSSRLLVSGPVFAQGCIAKLHDYKVLVC